MARNLEELLHPGERVVFRTRYSALRALGWGVLTLLILYALLLGIDLLAGDPSNPLSLLIFGVFWVAWVYFDHRSSIALLTDRRLLHLDGIFKRRIEEVLLEDVYRVEYGPTKYTHGQITITQHKGRQVRISDVPKRAELARQIAARAGVPLGGRKTRRD